MTLSDFFRAIGKKKQAVILIMVIFILVSVLITVVQPFKYGSSLRLLTVHSFKENTDPYIASKSNEYLSNLLAKIVYSNSFFAKIKESGFNVDKDYFKGNEKRQIKKWETTVRARSIGDTGIIALDAYHTDREQAEQIARAIAYTLQTDHALYHGFGENVSIKIIDKPITSTLPVKPNIILNLTLAVVFSIIFSLSYVYLFPGERSRAKFGFAEERATEANYANDNWESVGQVIERKDEDRENSYQEDVTKEDFENSGNMHNILSE